MKCCSCEKGGKWLQKLETFSLVTAVSNSHTVAYFGNLLYCIKQAQLSCYSPLKLLVTCIYFRSSHVSCLIPLDTKELSFSVSYSVRSGKNISGTFLAEYHLKATAGKLHLHFIVEVWMLYQSLCSLFIICCGNTNIKNVSPITFKPELERRQQDPQSLSLALQSE